MYSTLVYSIYYRLLYSLVVECRLRVREVPGSIPCQGPRHTKDVIKMVQEESYGIESSRHFPYLEM